jgi:hypothetical protein
MHIDEAKLRELNELARHVAERTVDNDVRALANCLAELCESISDFTVHELSHDAAEELGTAMKAPSVRLFK